LNESKIITTEEMEDYKLQVQKKKTKSLLSFFFSFLGTCNQIKEIASLPRYHLPSGIQK
jgi:hypothetical protein